MFLSFNYYFLSLKNGKMSALTNQLAPKKNNAMASINHGHGIAAEKWKPGIKSSRNKGVKTSRNKLNDVISPIPHTL